MDKILKSIHDITREEISRLKDYIKPLKDGEYRMEGAKGSGLMVDITDEEISDAEDRIRILESSLYRSQNIGSDFKK